MPIHDRTYTPGAVTLFAPSVRDRKGSAREIDAHQVLNLEISADSQPPLMLVHGLEREGVRAIEQRTGKLTG